MRISAGTMTVRAPPPRTPPPSTPPPGGRAFADMVADAAGRPPPDARPDFSCMTPDAFRAEAKAMYDRGEIDLHTLGVMTMRAHSAPADDYAALGGGRYDFAKMFRGSMAFLVQTGRAHEPTSAYETYRTILSKIG